MLKLLNNKYVLYYSILYLILISWTNPYNPPPILLRYVFTIAVFLPTFSNLELIPIIFSLFIITNTLFINASFIVPNLSFRVIIVLLIYKILKDGIRYDKDYIIFISLLIYYLIIDFSNGLSISISNSSSYVYSLSFAALCYPFINNRKAFELMSIGFVISAIILSAFHITFNNYISSSIASNFSARNDVSYLRDRNYLMVSAVIGMTILLMNYFDLLIISSIKLNKKVVLLLSAFLLISIIVIASRTALVGASVACIMVLITSSDTNISKRFKRNIVFVFSIALFILLSAELGLTNSMQYRLFEEGSLETGSGRTDIQTMLLNGFSLLDLNDMIFGRGYGTHTVLTGGIDTHNDFLAILASYGILGLVFWIVFLSRFIVGHDKTLSRIVIIIYIVIALLISPLMSITLPFFLIWGLASKRLNKLRKNA